MKILAYQGISFVSRLIRWQTRSIYSHVAVELPNGTMIEAWHKGGVIHREDFHEGHTTGTKVTVFSVNADFNRAEVMDYLLSQVGQKYDFKSVFRFLTRRMAPNNSAKFCSELVGIAWIKGGCKLLRGNPSEQSPRDITLSPLLKEEETRVVL